MWRKQRHGLLLQEPAHYPNGYNGPVARGRDWHQDRVEGVTNRDDLVSTDDYSQARKLVMEVFDDAARERFVANVAGNLVYAPPFVRVRSLMHALLFVAEVVNAKTNFFLR